MAGVYPVGLKIVVSWYPRARGMALGVLIGALSVGSALPQLLTAVAVLPWRGVLLGRPNSLPPLSACWGYPTPRPPG